MADLTERFGTMVFSEDEMKRWLPKDVYKRLAKTIEEGESLDLDVANAVTHAMKEWALLHGATHYAHWFQPLSGITSEKYNKLMNIEATTMVREARRTYRPVITAYATKVAKGLEAIRAAGADAAMQCEQNTLNKLCYGITEINDSIKALDALHKEAEALDGQEQANKYAHEVVPAMDRLRAAVDAMEEIVARDYWPVPTYDDILFYV